MRYRPGSPFSHGQVPRTAVLLCNLGTPDEPTAPALRRYLAEFLSDPRVVEIPALLWRIILHGIILRVRPAKSAAKYASIWLAEGSPLRVWTDRQAKLLGGYLGERGHVLTVRYAMRYGNPGIPQVLDELLASGATRVLILPAYPQYSAATTASTIDAVGAWAARRRKLPELRFVNNFHDDPGYIAALANSVREHWAREGQAGMLVMSFHGMPERTLHLGDPYHCECLKTGRLLAEALNLREDGYLVTFQSRFGRAKWLQPYTEPSLKRLAGQGVQRVDVICPGFSADCLETLEEIKQEASAAFLAAGGKDFHYIPCLNARPDWINALASISERHLQGWPTEAQPDATTLQRQREAALALGAKD